MHVWTDDVKKFGFLDSPGESKFFFPNKASAIFIYDHLRCSGGVPVSYHDPRARPFHLVPLEFLHPLPRALSAAPAHGQAVVLPQPQGLAPHVHRAVVGLVTSGGGRREDEVSVAAGKEKKYLRGITCARNASSRM